MPTAATATDPAPAGPDEAAAPASPSAPPGDPLLVAAVELARAVAVEVSGAEVGEHLGVEVEDSHAVTHSFAAVEKGYVGWRWAVTVARAEGSETVTVDEVVLLPGSGALLSPEWVPWSERVKPGDLGAGDLLPTSPDDRRLVASFEDPADLEPGGPGELPWALGRELGLGRERVLSLDGRLDAAERWYDGDGGPRSPLAKAAPASCGSCGFLVLLAGALSQGFGACANGFAPDDGRVVSLDHGCGAHSSVVVDAAHAATGGLAVEHEELELVASEPQEPADLTGPPAAAQASEFLGHS